MSSSTWTDLPRDLENFWNPGGISSFHCLLCWTAGAPQCHMFQKNMLHAGIPNPKLLGPHHFLTWTQEMKGKYEAIPDTERTPAQQPLGTFRISLHPVCVGSFSMSYSSLPMVPIPKLRQLLQACGPRIITKLEEIVKSMDSILAGINDVYAAGAVEGYSPEYFILCPSKSFVSQTNSLKIYHLYNRDCDPTHFIWVCLDSGFWDMLILIIWVHWLAQERSQAARPVQGVYPDVPCQFLL